MTTRTVAQVKLDRTVGPFLKVHAFKDGAQRIFFEDEYIHYLHPETLASLDMMTISGLKNAEVHFLGQLIGDRTHWKSYLDDSAVLNIVDCENADEAREHAKRCPHNRIGTVEVREVIPMGPPPQ